VDAGNGRKARFEIDNPVRGSFPKWTPEELPATRNDGNASITLNRLSWKDGWNPYVRGETTVRHKDVPADDYDAPGQFMDATGNIGDWNRLCTNEAAWKLSATYCRVVKASFAESEIWRPGKVRAPRNGEGMTLGRTGQLSGVQLKLLALAGPGTFEISNNVFVASSAETSEWQRLSFGRNENGPYVHGGIAQKHPFLFVEVQGIGNDQLLFIRAKDRDDKIAVPQSMFTSNDIRFYVFRNEVFADEVDLEFMVEKPIHAEFFVKPLMTEPPTSRP
jgi:hypothetical protein